MEKNQKIIDDQETNNKERKVELDKILKDRKDELEVGLKPFRDQIADS